MGSPSEYKRPIKGRVGHDFARFRGVNSESDPGALSVDEFTELINVRFRGGRPKERAGLSKVNSGGAMTGTVTGITEERLYGAGSGESLVGGRAVRWYGIQMTDSPSEINGSDPGRYTSGSLLYSCDETLTTPVETITYSSAKYYNGIFCDTDGTVYIAETAGNASLVDNSEQGVVHYLCAFRPAIVDGASGTVAATQEAPARIVRMPNVDSKISGGYCSAHISAITRVGPNLFISTHGDPAVPFYPTVYRWDGTTLTVDDYQSPATGNLSPRMFPYGDDQLFVIYTGGTTTDLTMRYRNSAGTWSTIANPASFTPLGPTSSAVFKDVLYVGGGFSTDTYSAGNARILSFDRTTATAVRQPSASGGSNVGVVGGMVSTSSYLYYAWTDAISGTSATTYIGRFDGTTWDDDWQTLGASRVALGMIRANGKVYLIGGGVTGGLLNSTRTVYSSDESDLTSWTAVTGTFSAGTGNNQAFPGSTSLVAV